MRRRCNTRINFSNIVLIRFDNTTNRLLLLGRCQSSSLVEFVESTTKSVKTGNLRLGSIELRNHPSDSFRALFSLSASEFSYRRENGSALKIYLYDGRFQSFFIFSTIRTLSRRTPLLLILPWLVLNCPHYNSWRQSSSIRLCLYKARHRTRHDWWAIHSATLYINAPGLMLVKRCYLLPLVF